MCNQTPTGFSIYRNRGGHTNWNEAGVTQKATLAFLTHGIMLADGTVYQS
jgi:hypothetical protein